MKFKDMLRMLEGTHFTIDAARSSEALKCFVDNIDNKVDFQTGVGVAIGILGTLHLVGEYGIPEDLDEVVSGAIEGNGP